MTAELPVPILRRVVNRLERTRSAVRARAAFAKACDHGALVKKSHREIRQLNELIRRLREACGMRGRS